MQVISILKLVKSGGLSVDQRMCIPSDSRRTVGLPPLPQTADQLFHWSTHKVLLHILRCSCKHYKEGPCSKQFTTTQIVEQRQQTFQLSAGKKDMLLLGVYNTITDNSTMLSTWIKGPRGKAERQHNWPHQVCP